MIGIEFGCVRMTSLGDDGTRIRANNSRQASRTPNRVRQMKKELEQAYEQHDRQAREADQQDEERFGERNANRVEADISDVKRELAKVNAALEQVDLLEENGKTVPKRIPVTDPGSRIMPNKTGGHADADFQHSPRGRVLEFALTKRCPFPILKLRDQY